MDNLRQAREERMHTKKTVAQLIALKKTASRKDIAEYFQYSMPTVLQKVKDLSDRGLVEETGVFESNSGRKAKALSLVRDVKYAVGINITPNHLELVFAGLNGDILSKRRMRENFSATKEYFRRLEAHVEAFVSENTAEKDKILGAGVSLPGILDQERSSLIVSHALHLNHFSLKPFISAIHYPVFFENDANSAANSETLFRSSTAVYLSLNNTVGGAFSVNGELYRGDHDKSAEFGHMILVPNGKKCYCGQFGCVDGYCAAKQLSADDLEGFFQRLQRGDAETKRRWERYCSYLEIVISNLRTAYDCDIILGGYVGGYLKDYMEDIGKGALSNNIFDIDTSFLHCGQYKWVASSYGIALQVIDQYLGTMT